MVLEELREIKLRNLLIRRMTTEIGYVASTVKVFDT